MAHAATLDHLAEQLVIAVTGREPHETCFGRLKGQTIRGLRDQTSARTNQFAIHDSLHGLVEKFTILNRADLADALQVRVGRLPSQSPWMPEILSLVLLLSDHPVQKTSMHDVQDANQFSEPANVLTWGDIVASEPLNEAGIWETTDRGYHSSGDDELDYADVSDATASSQATSVDESPTELARLHLTTSSGQTVSKVRATHRFWSSHTSDSKVAVPELTAVREILSMAHSLPSSLFTVDEWTGFVAVDVLSATLCTASASCSIDVLRACASTGGAVNRVRRWAVSAQRSAHLQSIQSCVSGHIASFDRQITNIEQRYIGVTADTTVSIMDVLAEINVLARPLICFGSLIEKSTKCDSSFALLDLLYHHLCAAPVSGEMGLFDALLSMFFSGMRTYLYAVSAWVCTGKVFASDRNDFFVLDADTDCDPGKLWHERHAVRSRSDCAPECIRPFIDTIFALGKSRFFLYQLAQRSEIIAHEQAPHSSRLDLANLAQRVKDEPYLPFPELVNEAIHRWLSEMDSDCTSLLCTTILRDHGLIDLLEALPYVFFSRDGSVLQSFEDALIKTLRTSNVRCLEMDSGYLRFVLAELAATTFGTIPAVSTENIHVDLIGSGTDGLGASVMSKLGCINIGYVLPWPIQNITRSKSLHWHSRVVALLLQVRYAGNLLHDIFLDLRLQTPLSAQSLKLCQRLINFVDTLYSHLVLTAHALHTAVLVQLQDAVTVDQMVAAWSLHEKKIQTALLVAPNLEPLQKAIINNLDISELLCNTREPPRIAALLDQFTQGVAFIAAGIRSTSRVDGGVALEVLAERLECIAQ